MTVTEAPPTAVQTVTVDLYRNIHKGIRRELFAVTTAAGSLDPADRAGRSALAGRVASTGEFLRTHAEHEDFGVQPVLVDELPDLASRIAEEHLVLESRIDHFVSRAQESVAVAASGARSLLHALYLELASFTSAYLEHQDFEERSVMPALERAIGVEAAAAIEHKIISNIPPAQMADSLAIMLPAMNLDDRAEMLGGMQAGAPAEVFQGVWALAGSVLDGREHAALAVRLGLS